MQAVILAGGKGIRMGEETLLTPKPMIRIGKMPILWHIMKHFYADGIDDFLILGGYKVEDIRTFFKNYAEETSPITFYGNIGPVNLSYVHREKWLVGVLNTGLEDVTGSRLLQANSYLQSEFILTYGDGVANVDTNKLIEFGRDSGKLVTITAVHPQGRFGTLDLKDDKLISFKEKPLEDDWVNGGFWYMKRKALSYIYTNEMLEQGGIQRLMGMDQVGVYKHEGFWHPMDTRRDKEYLTSLVEKNNAPWQNWG